MFPSVLVANRGEIACRVIRTCRRLGIRSIAVFSEADRGSPHTRMADEALCIGPAEAARSYLDVEAIVAAARMAGAAAVHPGYGFLSERAALPRRLTDAGIGWVGPSVAAIETMGSKRAAKALAREAGVDCVPGYDGADQSDAAFTREAARIGFPLLVKASVGGGGRGMRRVDAPDQLAEALVSARAEAAAAFGDDELLLERLVTRPRHLEVQIAGDRHGNIVHLGERECSIQRNYQKLIEEAPAPGVTLEARSYLHAAALRIGGAIGYDNLGTVEFVLDEGGDRPWFLEMNTRLQVEHTVTEAVTGLDLVEWQLRIAAGEALPLAQEAIVVRGHAIEARVNAEDPAQEFRPGTGTVLRFEPPAGLRSDAGITAGSVVTAYYDSLLAKIVAHGDDRAKARARLAAGLRALVLLGVSTNQTLLRDIVETPGFAAGRLTTLFLGETFPGGWRAPTEGDSDLAALAVWLAAQRRPDGPWGTLGSWRIVQPARIYVVIDGKEATVTEEGGSFDVAGRATRATCADGTLMLEPSGAPQRGYAWARDDQTIWLGREGVAWRHIVQLAGEGRTAPLSGADDGRLIRAPMPGLVTAVGVAPGDVVAAGTVCVTMEAMKVVLRLPAPDGGTVGTVRAAPGETVAGGAVLVELLPG